uniref:Integrase catalytic domain-containing protein n=1 Tax=Lactuca sativa TaxID=4236 RepID=A0A9R1WFE2_LACSA|nr:hypothetical protein LSAT_V11C200097150 [Lactuca sativa]
MDHGTFCYTKMPFGLKNVGATYQRLVDSVFTKQIGKNIEVYVDDMVIKSSHESKMLQDIKQTFRTLERVKMKLNPAKCTVGVEEGQFLGYYVTKQVIQPSPVKVDEFMETPPPGTLREVHGLNEKFTAVSRFISKSAGKAMPLFHTLKGCIEKNNFQWTAVAEEALQKIKEALHKLPTLAKTLVRLAKWAIELGEHDISYRPRTSIKGQALADFLLEIPDEGNSAKERIWAVEEVLANDYSWTLYSDMASNREGSGASLILTSPEGEEVTYALWFDFHTSNNKAAYEALLAGLCLAKQMGAKAVTALTDSRLFANQINRSFEARDQRMERYVRMIPRSENKRAYALSKLASTCFDHLSKKVLVEVLRERSIDERQINTLTTTGPTWMTPFMEYLQRGVLPDDHSEARKIHIKAPSYALINGELYRKGFTAPWLKCIDQAKGMEALQEAHAGQAGAHEGARALTGLFPEALGKLKYMVVAVDYFIKWIEAEPLTCISGRHMIKFVWKNIMTRFGTPKVLVSDNGLQFFENPFREWCASKGINQRFTSVAHPQANGQTEVSSLTIVNGIEKRLGKAKGNWSEEISAVLWSYITTPRKSTWETPFSLTYGMEDVLPMEITVGTLRAVNADEESNAQNLRLNLDVLEERREKLEIHQAAYKHVIERYYNQRVKEKAFRVGEYVLRRNKASRTQTQGKMGLVWEGPYKIRSK